MNESAPRDYLLGRRADRRRRKARRRARVRPRAFALIAVILALYFVWRDGAQALARPRGTDGSATAAAPSAAAQPAEPATTGSPPASAAPAPSAPEGNVPRRGPLTDADLRALREKLLQRAAPAADHYGVYVIDLVSGRGAGFNENRFFPAASTVKLPLAMYVLEEAARGRVKLDERIAYTPADYEEGTGVLQGEVDEGVTFPVRDLVRLALSRSDNIAANMLFRRFGQARVAQYARRFGVELRLTPGDNQATARGMALLLQRLMDPARVTEKTRKFILEALADTDAAPRLGRDLPEGIAAPHKIGTLPGVVNDVGLVLVPGRPLAVAVLSEDVEEAAAVERIGRLGAEAFTWARGLPPAPR